MFSFLSEPVNGSTNANLITSIVIANFSL